MNTSFNAKHFAGCSLISKPSLDESLFISETMQIIVKFEQTAVEVPDFNDLPKIYNALIKAFNAQERIPLGITKNLNLIGWAMVKSVQGYPLLFEVEGFLEWFNTKSPDNKKITSGLFNAFLFEYPVNSTHFGVLKETVKGRLFSSKSIRLKHLQKRTRKVDLFGTEPFKEFFTCLVNAHAQFEDRFDEAKSLYGMDGVNQTSKFYQHLLISLMGKLTQLFVDRQVQDSKSRLVHLLNEFLEEDTFRFYHLRVEFLDSVLNQFYNESPQRDIKDYLRDFIIKHFGDVRLEPQRWVGVSETATEVMRSWMVESTMQDFFSLLSAVAKTDRTADRHWHYRKAFWESYLKRGVVLDAWVVFGSKAKELANSFLNPEMKYATLTGGQNIHSALLIKIDNLVILEWSHSGAIRVWHDDASPPTMYRKNYHREDIVESPSFMPIHHFGSEMGGWQWQVSRLIEKHTGITMSRYEYMPR